MNESNKFIEAFHIPMTAKRLVLSLFAALNEHSLPISRLITGAEIFGIEEAAVRVAINRLVKEKLLSSIERGTYFVGDNGKVLYEASRAWERQNEKLLEWNGNWFCVHTSHLGRSDRKALRQRLRAFRLWGFAELEEGFWVRPANLALSCEQLAIELKELGLGDEAVILLASELLSKNSRFADGLWDRQHLEKSYVTALDAMSHSQSKLKSLPLFEASREVFEIGAAVVSVLTDDPLLPPEYVDADLRRQVHSSMLEYDSLGKVIWNSLFEEIEQAGRSEMVPKKTTAAL